MKIVDKISVAELHEMAQKMYGNIVKADIDVARKVVIVDMSMYADGEAELLEQGSKQDDLWGINLHPAKFNTPDFIEFDSMINLKPHKQNFSRDIDDSDTRQQITDIITGVVHE